MKKFNDWIDSLSNWAWLAVLLAMVMAIACHGHGI